MARTMVTETQVLEDIEPKMVETKVVEPKVVTTKRVIEDNVVHVRRDDLWLIKTAQVIWFVLAIIEILIGFRIALKLLGAAAASGFASFIYFLSEPLTAPFNGILRATFGVGGPVLEWSSILAAIVYAILAWVIVYLMHILHPVHPDHVGEDTVEP